MQTNRFQSELSEIFSNLQSDHTVHILGDYNVGLLKVMHSDTGAFKNVVFSSDFIPLLSTPTHQRGECKKNLH